MSDLRKHLESARQEYQSLRYPGDLGNDIFQRRRPSRLNLFIGVAAVAAIAAGLLIVVRMRTTVPPSTQVQVAAQTPQSDDGTDVDSEDETQPEVASFGQLPAMSLPSGVSGGLDLAPTAPDFSFSAPSFTTLTSDDQNSQSASTTKESA